ncbi:MAG: hypothetical protein K5989_05055 [Lachnospiraceae bacterium]|nr:hypothetical protein [Lachnospiraceae bacterium]
MDYALFVEGKHVGVVEAKKTELGEKITTVEEKTPGRFSFYETKQCRRKITKITKHVSNFDFEDVYEEI